MGGGLVLEKVLLERMEVRTRVEGSFEHGSAETGEGK